jgi:hypothetical protein
MSFTKYKYRRPNLKKLTKSFEQHVATFENAPTLEEAATELKKINRLRSTFLTAYNIGHIRHTIDTSNAVYEIRPLLKHWKAIFIKNSLCIVFVPH